MTITTNCLTLRPSYSFSLTPTSTPSLAPTSSHTLSFPYARQLLHSLRASLSPAVLDHQEVDSFGEYDEEQQDVVSDQDYLKSKSTPPCELYVCNLPRSCDIPELVEMFRPFGTVLSVEISRNPTNGISRGSGYVTFDSVESAKAAIRSLDTSDVGGREMRVRFSIHMNPKRRSNSMAMNSTPVKSLVYESPHKVYVGNLAWSIKPEDLRQEFKRFGTITSTRVLHDHKKGKGRAYGFISFSSASERDAAKSLDGTEIYGRIMIVRDGAPRE